MEQIKQNDNEIVDWIFFMKKRVNVGGAKSSLERALVFGARVRHLLILAAALLWPWDDSLLLCWLLVGFILPMGLPVALCCIFIIPFFCITDHGRKS